MIVIEYVIDNAPLLMSALAMFTSLCIFYSNKKFQKDINNRQQEVVGYEKRTAMLEELDKQHTTLKRIEARAKKMMRSGEYKEDHKSLESKVEDTQHIRKIITKNREKILCLKDGLCPDVNERTLAEHRRLTLNLEADLDILSMK